MHGTLRTFLILAIPGALSGFPASAAVCRAAGWVHNVERSAVGAALEPRTWVPVAGALLLQVDDLDSRISNWAWKRTPIGGSPDGAARLSDRLLLASAAAYWLTVGLAPAGDQEGGWLAVRAKRAGVGIVATALTQSATDGLKASTGRLRPDRSNRQSLPSGHSSQVGAFSALSGRNAPSLDVPFYALAVACAWSRVEAGKHYPSDVLVGLALGHYLAAFVNDSVMRGNRQRDLSLSVVPDRSGLAAEIRLRF
jgi:membrane-associated phospholipid phosphatase